MILPGHRGFSLEVAGDETIKKISPAPPCEVTGEKKPKETTAGDKPSCSKRVGAAVSNYISKDSENPRSKLKLSELMSRDPAEETSEGIQELIKVVSNFLEKKYPFHEKRARSCSSSKSEETGQGNKNSNKRKEIPGENSKFQNKKSRKPARMDFSKTNQNKKLEGGFITKKPPIEKPEPSTRPFGKDQEKVPQVQEGNTVIGQTQRKVIRPSEIPLRKKVSRRLQTALLKNYLKENERGAAMHPNKGKKVFSPIQESSLSSIQAASADKSPDKKAQTLKEPTPNKDIKHERHSKRPEMCLLPETSMGELDSGRKTKLPDLNEVKNTSFPVNTLHKLESLHQQNISAKESANTPKKKDAGRKASYTVLKVKTSNKVKASKSRSKQNTKEQDKSSPSRKKSPHTNICKKIAATGEVGNVSLVPDSSEREAADQKENQNTSPKQKPSPPAVKPIRKMLPPSSDRESKSISEQNLRSELQKNQRVVGIKLMIYDQNPELPANHPTTPVNNKRESTVKSGTTSTEMTPPPTPEENISKNNTARQCEKPSKTIISGQSKGKPQGFQKDSMKSKNEQEKDKLVVKGVGMKGLTAEAPRKSNPEKMKLQIKVDMSSESPKKNSVESYIDHPQIDPSSHGLLLPRLSIPTVVKTKEDGTDTSPGLAKEPTQLKLRKNYRSSCSLKTRLKNKMSSVNLRTMAKKRQMRSDAGDRRILSPSGSFNSGLSSRFPDKLKKLKPDMKLRSGLTKSRNREGKLSRERKSLVDDSAVIKLRRRNSEPYSCRGFVWKHPDPVVSKGNKASVSSMASSLKHLNTDELDDFIFWEAVPQMTSCWEMSLYHFKKPWSMLSCTVFDDNRKSNTPGRILDNLRNGGILNIRRSVVSHSESVIPQKENDFDVEPSIAQKNIDIRNWLSALNFPVPPSTSSDTLGEAIRSSARLEGSSVESHDSGSQVSSRRRKVFPSVKFSEEVVEKNMNDRRRSKGSEKWKSGEMGDLMDLIRRKSGGFVTSQQFFNPDPISLPESSANVCICTRNSDWISTEEKASSVVFETADVSTQSETLMQEKAVKESTTKDSRGPPSEDTLGPPEHFGGHSENKRLPRDTLNHNLPPTTNHNVWKYLFLLTALVFFFYVFSSEGKICE